MNGVPTKAELRRERNRKRKSREGSKTGKRGPVSGADVGPGKKMPRDFEVPPGWELELHTVQRGVSRGKQNKR